MRMNSFGDALELYNRSTSGSGRELMEIPCVAGFSGFRRHGLNLIGGQKYVGLTDFLLTIAIECAAKGEYTLFLTTHHSELEVVRRIMFSSKNRNHDQTAAENLKRHLYIYEVEQEEVPKLGTVLAELLKASPISNILLDTCEADVSAVSEFQRDHQSTVLVAKHLIESVAQNLDYRPRYKDFALAGLRPKLADVVVALNRLDVYGVIQDEDGNNTEDRTEFLVIKSPYEKSNKRYAMAAQH